MRANCKNRLVRERTEVPRASEPVQRRRVRLWGLPQFYQRRAAWADRI